MKSFYRSATKKKDRNSSLWTAQDSANKNISETKSAAKVLHDTINKETNTYKYNEIMTEIIEHKERKKKTKEKERGPSSHNCEILKTTVIAPPTPKK